MQHVVADTHRRVPAHILARRVSAVVRAQMIDTSTFANVRESDVSVKG